MQTAEELTMTGLSLVFLLLGVILIASIVLSAFNPYEQIAVGNARKLAAVMNQACVSGTEAIKLDLALPQNVPIGSNFLTVLPKWLIRKSGDPNYVIYYESFPPGEGIGWETYSDFDHRLYVMLPEKDPGREDGQWGIESAGEYVKERMNAFRTSNPQITLEGAVAANIVLNDRYSGIELTKVETKLADTEGFLGKNSPFGRGGDSGRGGTGTDFGSPSKFFGFGSWDSAKSDPQGQQLPATEEDFFRFRNYEGLPAASKSMIKYESCGPYALCMKTRDGVYRFPLKNCQGKGEKEDIKTVQLVYDARASRSIDAIEKIPVSVGKAFIGIFALKWKTPIPLGGGKLLGIGLVADALYEQFKSYAGAFYSIKTGDFLLASPCSINKAEVRVAECKSAEGGYLSNYNPCEAYINYTIFSADKDGNLAQAGRHFLCTNYLKTKERKDIGRPPAAEPAKDDKCLQVKISEPPTGFCWTADPSYFMDSLDQITFGGFIPVTNSMEYASSTQDIVLKPTRIQDLEGFLAGTGRFLSWGWPFESVSGSGR